AAEAAAKKAAKAKQAAEAAAKRAAEEASARAKSLAAKAKAATKKGAGSCKRHSFIAGTSVLMADGSTKPIEQTTPGDTVLATDPITGVTEPRQVTRTIRTDDDEEFIDITVEGDGNPPTITTTEHHPFWSVTQGRWVEAGQLQAGELLRTS